MNTPVHICPHCGNALPQTVIVSLTGRMLDAAQFIADGLTANGYAPSYDEMAAHLGLKSRSSINRLISNLERRGWLIRLPHRARAITLTEAARDRLRTAPERKAA